MSSRDPVEQVDPWKYRIPTGGELRVMRNYLGLTTEEVSDAMGYKRSTIRNWEKGETSPRLRDTKKLLDYYKMAFYEKALEYHATEEDIR